MKYSDKILEFATKAHAGQFRKYGNNVPYITHPIAVSENAVRMHIESKSFDATDEAVLEIIRSIGIAHDVIEDTNVTFGEFLTFLDNLVDIRVGGLPKSEHVFTICHVVALLTKKKTDFDLFEYLDGIKYDYYAKLVKLADLEHNMSDLKDQKKLDYYRLVRYYLTH